jgi:hypothetical protein
MSMRYGLIVTAICALAPRAEVSTDSAHTDSLRLYLCTADSAGPSEGRKLVYSYIDGDKTDCMPEQALMELIGRRRFERQRDSLRAERKKADDYYIEAIKHGERSLQNADLRMADLMGARLEGADLRNADLSNADLRDADLSRADLRGADLRIAYCKDADFSGARMDSIDCTGAYFNGADLRGATGLSVEMLAAARTLHEARLDSTLLVKLREEAPEKRDKPAEGWMLNQWAPPADSARPSK